VTFPAHQRVLLRVEYKMDGSGVPFTGIGYILETGAGWYGRIFSADIILHLPYPASLDVIEDASPGYVFSGNEMRWKLKNFEPTRSNNLSVKVLYPEDWHIMHDLRSNAERNPYVAETWYELGDEYRQLARRGSQHFAGLSIKSYEKAIALRPDWGDAHLQLANILWHGNPKVKQALMNGAYKISMEDPTLQRVLKELKLARTYGAISMPDERDRLIYEMNAVVPGLNLTLPVTLTFTPKPATKTAMAAPSQTSTPTAFVASTGIPLPSAAPAPAPPRPSSSGAVGGMVVGLLIVVGVLIYSWRSKFGDRN